MLTDGKINIVIFSFTRPCILFCLLLNIHRKIILFAYLFISMGNFSVISARCCVVCLWFIFKVWSEWNSSSQTYFHKLVNWFDVIFNWLHITRNSLCLIMLREEINLICLQKVNLGKTNFLIKVHLTIAYRYQIFFFCYWNI